MIWFFVVVKVKVMKQVERESGSCLHLQEVLLSLRTVCWVSGCQSLCTGNSTKDNERFYYFPHLIAVSTISF